MLITLQIANANRSQSTGLTVDYQIVIIISLN